MRYFKSIFTFLHGEAMVRHCLCPSSCSVDTFEIATLNVGALKRVRIGHDNKGVAAGWFLDKVFFIHLSFPSLLYVVIWF